MGKEKKSGGLVMRYEERVFLVGDGSVPPAMGVIDSGITGMHAIKLQHENDLQERDIEVRQKRIDREQNNRKARMFGKANKRDVYKRA